MKYLRINMAEDVQYLNTENNTEKLEKTNKWNFIHERTQYC